MKHCRHRLLIVESATIARSIAALHLPGLEVLATGGYAWLPQVAHDATGKPELKARANPEDKHRRFRNALKAAAQPATEIVIATDPDPSGGFIASCIARFLKHDARLRRGYLSRLSAPSVQQLMEAAVPLDQAASASTSEALRQYFIHRQKRRSAAREELSARGLPIPAGSDPAALALTRSRLRSANARNFIVTLRNNDGHPIHLQTPGPIPVPDSPLALSAMPPDTSPLYPALPQPLSAACIGAFLPSALKTQHYDGLQRQLNLLFSIPPEKASAPISYPRAGARAWTAENWEQLSASLMRFERAGAELLRPNALRQRHVLGPDAGHQGLHITDFAQTPHHMRRFLKPPALALYQYIYDGTRAALCYPPALPPARLLHDTAGRIFYTETAADAQKLRGKTLSVRPFVPLADLLQSLLDSGRVKASSLGKTADALCKCPWLRFHHAPVPHLRCR
ncbi:MAG: hypothetical protein ACOC2C_05925 [Cyclonatronaceae bacterium]